LADESDSVVALLPIRPRYAAAILAGTKTVEFRRRPFGRPVTHIVIYASAPIQCVVGVFSVDRVEEGCAGEIWARCGSLGAIDEEDYDRYYLQAESAFAIHIERVWRLHEPLRLSDIGVEHVPQSFAYLSEWAVQVLAQCVVEDPPAIARKVTNEWQRSNLVLESKGPSRKPLMLATIAGRSLPKGPAAQR
jgi:predicted transcriptional regulator